MHEYSVIFRCEIDSYRSPIAQLFARVISRMNRLPDLDISFSKLDDAGWIDLDGMAHYEKACPSLELAAAFAPEKGTTP